MEPILGEIKIVSFDFAPLGWAICDGQALSITQNQALYALLGTVFGGNGTTTFNLPDFRGRVPVHFGGTIPFGESGGEAAHTLAVNEIPAHTHAVQASNAVANAPSPLGNAWPSVTQGYAGTPDADMKATALGNAGAGLEHDNLQPYTVVNFIIATTGVFPSRS